VDLLRDTNEPDCPEAWVKATWPRAIIYARSLLRERSAAEDVVQDCLCNLLRRADAYDLPRDGVRLLMTSISHACLKKNTRGRPVLSLTGDDDGPIDPTDTAALEPPRVVLHAELESAIAAGLARLPERQRAAVELKALGHSLAEVADILGVASSHAGVLVHRGRQALAEQLAPYLERRPDERTGT
jgi:RNA polymerase sigma factor (sigma-70 family)